MTDAEWAHIEPLIPPGKPGGGKRRVAIREVINGVMYILSTGCQWRALPKDLPPRSTVHDYLGLWNWDGTLDRIHHALYLKCREKAAREACPSYKFRPAQKSGPFRVVLDSVCDPHTILRHGVLSNFRSRAMR